MTAQVPPALAPFFPRSPDAPILEALAVALLGGGLAHYIEADGRRAALGICVVLGWAALASAYGHKRERMRERAWSVLASRYCLSHLGFLPAEPPRRLDHAEPGKGPYAKLEALSARLPELNRVPGALRAAVDAEASLVADEAIVALGGEGGGAKEPQLRRAYVLLAQLVHSYANGHKVVWPREGEGGEGPGLAGSKAGAKAGAEEGAKAEEAGEGTAAGAATAASAALLIPGQLAVPFHFVCGQLGLPPVLTAVGTDCWNWTLEREAAGGGGGELLR